MQWTGNGLPKEDADHEDERRDEGRAELQAPRDVGHVLDNDIGAEAEEDACGDPELPEHDQGATDASRSHLGGVDGHGSVLRADADAHDEACCEKALPRLRKARADRGGGQAGACDENLASAAEIVVQRVDNEGAAEGTSQLRVARQSPEFSTGDSHQTGGQENDGVDDADDPFVQALAVDVELLRERQIGAVGTRLIPTLRRGTDGAQRNGIPQHRGAVPLVVPLVSQGFALGRIQLADRVKGLRVARDERGAPEEGGVLGHVVRLGEGTRIGDGLLGGEALCGESVSFPCLRELLPLDAPSADSRRCSAPRSYGGDRPPRRRRRRRPCRRRHASRSSLRAQRRSCCPKTTCPT